MLSKQVHGRIVTRLLPSGPKRERQYSELNTARKLFKVGDGNDSCFSRKDVRELRNQIDCQNNDLNPNHRLENINSLAARKSSVGLRVVRNVALFSFVATALLLIVCVLVKHSIISIPALHTRWAMIFASFSTISCSVAFITLLIKDYRGISSGHNFNSLLAGEYAKWVEVGVLTMENIWTSVVYSAIYGSKSVPELMNQCNIKDFDSFFKYLCGDLNQVNRISTLNVRNDVCLTNSDFASFLLFALYCGTINIDTIARLINVDDQFSSDNTLEDKVKIISETLTKLRDIDSLWVKVTSYLSSESEMVDSNAVQCFMRYNDSALHNALIRDNQTV